MEHPILILHFCLFKFNLRESPGQDLDELVNIIPGSSPVSKTGIYSENNFSKVKGHCFLKDWLFLLHIIQTFLI